eukprot:1345815-Pleurochrysis_carterae.AAC.1
MPGDAHERLIHTDTQECNDTCMYARRHLHQQCTSARTRARALRSLARAASHLLPSRDGCCAAGMKTHMSQPIGLFRDEESHSTNADSPRGRLLPRLLTMRTIARTRDALALAHPRLSAWKHK